MESNTSHVFSTPMESCNPNYTPSTLNLTEDSGYHSNLSGCTSTNSSSILNQTKSLDESQRPLDSINESSSIIVSDRLCFAGQKYVDFVYYLGDWYHQEVILEEIFKHLKDEDLYSCSLVSKLWRDIINSIPSEEKRLRIYVRRIELNKENRRTHSPKKGYPHDDVRCFTTLTPRHKLVQIQNIQESASSSSASPPTIKHNYRFEAYQKEARKLKVGKRLYSCPKCKLPSHVDPKIQNTAVCTNSTCFYRFCIMCQCEEHLFKSCHFISTPVARKPADYIGTAKSKKNLKRLLI